MGENHVIALLQNTKEMGFLWIIRSLEGLDEGGGLFTSMNSTHFSLNKTFITGEHLDICILPCHQGTITVMSYDTLEPQNWWQSDQ